MVAPISVCLIVRDESHQLENCLKSIRPYVAQIVIVDTGSRDSSLEISRKYADIVETFTDCNDPATRTPDDPHGRILRFDEARNRAFSHATQPWVMWVDGDDEVVGAEHLEELCREYDIARKGGPSLVMMQYEYSRDDKGRVTMIHDRERLATPKEAFHWVGWVHEVFVPKAGDLRQRTEKVKMVHHRNSAHKPLEPGRNLRILKAQYEKFGDADARHLYYLGMEYGNNGDIPNAINFLTKYVEKSGWDDEKYMATQLVANHYMGPGDYEKALEWAMKGVVLHEEWGEAYFTAAKCCYYLGQRAESKNQSGLRWWQRSVHFARTGLALPPTRTTLFVNPMERDFEIYRYLNFALSKMGETKGALEAANQALTVRPDDGPLLLNKNIYVDFLAKEDLGRSLNQLVEIGKISRDVRKYVDQVIATNSVPSAPPAEVKESASNRPLDSGAERSLVAPSLTPLRSSLDLILYVGRGVEAWNPISADKTGIGGSETAALEMSKRLVRLGHRVRLYGDCFPRDGSSSLEGVFDGVQYFDSSKYKDLSCDVLLASRRPEAVDDSNNIQRRVAVCWVHDVHCGSSLTHERALKFDKILALSEWHQANILGMYPYVHPTQMFRTRNGIDLSRFEKQISRNPHRAVYSSSPDRGMQVAICIWPLVRQRVPDAELHVYYGFQTWEACADEGQQKLIAYLKGMLRDYESAGVTFHGRISQKALAEEYLKSGVWTYPTWFAETSCISAMEAHAAGLRMVTSPIAALNETVGSRGTMIGGDWLSWDYQSRFVDAVVDAMIKTDDSDRLQLKSHAMQHFGWDNLANEWGAMFTGFIEEVSLNVVPKYKGWL